MKDEKIKTISLKDSKLFTNKFINLFLINNMGFKTNLLFKFLIYFSILLFVIKIYHEKIYESKEYKDLLKFYASKIPFSEEHINILQLFIQSYLKEIILFSGFSCVLSMFGLKPFSLITCFLYGLLAVSNFMIKKDIFTFNFYHISQEFLLVIAPVVLIPLTELNIMCRTNSNYDDKKEKNNKKPESS